MLELGLPRLEWKALHFGLVMFASSAMNNIFVTYYLDYFMNVVKIDPSAFYVGQIVFMLWNASNDPVFGFLSDKFWKSYSPIQRRGMLIEYGGFLWCIAFSMVWMPVFGSGSFTWGCLQFSALLCFYDGMLTLVEVNHSALLADLSVNSGERAKLNAYAAVCAGLGSLSSLFGHVLWDRSSLQAFRVLCVSVSALCGYLFFVASKGIRGSRASTPAMSEATDTHRTPLPGVSRLVKEMMQQRNLWVFQVLYFIQAFDCTFGKNHFSIFLDLFAGQRYSQATIGAVISASFVLPWIGTVVLTPYIQRHGLYVTVRRIFAARVALCVLFLLIPGISPFVVACFTLLNRVVSESICRLCPLIISDLVDEDRFINKRDDTLSASLVGASTLFGKASQSLAPILGFSMLAGSSQTSISYVLGLLPLLCVGCQMLLWDMYTLHGSYLKRVKEGSTRYLLDSEEDALV